MSSMEVPSQMGGLNAYFYGTKNGKVISGSNQRYTANIFFPSVNMNHIFSNNFIVKLDKGDLLSYVALTTLSNTNLMGSTLNDWNRR